MSAALFGANLLEEVREESLDQVLSELRHALESDSRLHIGIPELDSLIALFHKSDGEQLAILNSELDLPVSAYNGNVDDREVGHLRRGVSGRKAPFIEITHAAPTINTANLLYHIAAVSTIEQSHGGKASAVVWLDTDTTFSASRLHQACISFLNKSDPSLPQTTLTKIADEALKHVHVYSISSSRQLLNVLESLPDYLLQIHSTSNTANTHFSMHRPLSMIILDSATAFHWTDRFDAEVARLEAIKAPGTTMSPMTTTNTGTGTSNTTPPQAQPPPATTQLISALKSLQIKFDCMCVYTTHPQPSLHTSHMHRAPTATTTTTTAIAAPSRRHDEQATFSPWTQAATLSLSLSRVPVPQFASHMSLAECLRDRAKRQEVVARHRVRVGVSEEWLSGVVRDRVVRNSLAAVEGRGAFVFRVGDGTVDIE